MNWINVKEQLPEKDKLVLVCDRHGQCGLDRRINKTEFMDKNKWEWWTPLPELPI